MPEDLVAFERMEHGPAFGRVRQVLEASADGQGAPRVSPRAVRARRAASRDRLGRPRRGERLALEEGDLEDVNARLNQFMTRLATSRRRWSPTIRSSSRARPKIDARKASLDASRERLDARVAEMLADDAATRSSSAGRREAVPRADRGLADPARRRSQSGVAPRRVGLFITRLWRFVTESPREANTDGGVWPAIFGTMLMTLLMTIFVVPFG